MLIFAQKLNDMKVFGCTRQDEWSGGVILVAANNVNEAFSVAAKDDNSFVYFLYYNRKGKIVDDWHQASKIVSTMYPREKWIEYKSLTANVDTPQVILDEGYDE
jgi:hypothetical protein